MGVELIAIPNTRIASLPIPTDELVVGEVLHVCRVVPLSHFRALGTSRVVRGIRELLAQLQVVQNEPVAVVGYAQAVRGLAIGGGGKVGADPGGQPCASVRNNAQFSVPNAASTQ